MKEMEDAVKTEATEAAEAAETAAATEEAAQAEESIPQEPEAENVPEEKPAKRKATDGMELQDYLWIGVIVAAVIAFLFVLISQSALNAQGFYQFQAFGMKQPIKFEWLTASLAGWIAGGFGVLSLGCGVGRNILKKKNRSTINIIPGIAMTVLAAICLLAIRFKK
ncbi:MAG: hypothetical protein ILO68_08360 [Clostridia bacterium]|nr:hypothetical protein [Clostridia bacterium]